MVGTSTRSVDYKKKIVLCTVLDVRLDVEYDVQYDGIVYYWSIRGSPRSKASLLTN